MNDMSLEPSSADILPIHRLAVKSDWIDSNRHMNAAFYTVAVKDAAMMAHEEWDYGLAFRQRTGQSNFVLDSRVIYLRELLVDTPLKVTTRILDFDDKRMWLLFEIWNDVDNFIAALVRYLVIHVEMGPPARAVPMPPDLHRRLAIVHRRHSALPLPAEAGRFDKQDLYNSK